MDQKQHIPASAFKDLRQSWFVTMLQLLVRPVQTQKDTIHHPAGGQGGGLANPEAPAACLLCLQFQWKWAASASI